MSTPQIQFDDGAAYERYMGKWSQKAGDAFLDWLSPAPGLRWLDVGCGNGAFTETVFDRCAPASVVGIDPSEAQLAFARTRLEARGATFRNADAMALPFNADVFDVAVMPLVIFFVPDPARGVAEMSRVVRSGGSVAAYAWDLPDGGFPYALLMNELRAMGRVVPEAPSPDASRLENLQALWKGAGLTEVTTHVITVQRTFDDFDDYWTTVKGAPSAGRSLAAMAADDVTRLQATLRERLPADSSGRITCRARAHAVKGQVQE